MPEKYFSDNINLVKMLVNRICFENFLKEDLLQAGLMGLYEASKKFDQKKEFAFSSFAAKYIIGSIHEELRKQKRIHIPRNNTEKINVTSLSAISEELNEDCNDILRDNANESSKFEELIDSLAPIEKFILRGKFVFNHTEDYLAKRLGVSQSYLHFIYKKAILNLRNESKIV